MAIIINESHKYYIRGKIIDINDVTFTISVTSPFTCEIEFDCSLEYYGVLHPPVSSKYNWISWVKGDGHPNISEASAYYNTKDKCFYKKESGRESEWKATDFEEIYDDNPSLVTKNPNIIQGQEKYWFFQGRYRSLLQKEQSCSFSAYVLRENEAGVLSVVSKLRRHPDYDYFWIYDDLLMRKNGMQNLLII